METGTADKKMGRPTVFSETVLQKCVDLFGEGKTDEQVAKIIGVTSQTIRNWRKSHEEFFWATKEAKLLADEMVEASLFKKAIGFNYFEEQATKDGIQSLQKFSTPDTKAQIFWLKNRKPKDWKDKVEIENRSTASIFLDPGTGDKEEIPL